MATTRKSRKLEKYAKKRHFGKTPEPRPSAGKRRGRGKGLRFVVQKHAARQLHYDLRLEMEGVMRSWAVPKGPSLDPDTRRLAMEVEDHPIEYNEFEGTIPEGEYGAGTVMIWDQGTYTPDDLEPGQDPEKAAVEGYREGKLSFTLSGERLHGSFTLVRTDTVEGGERSKWLLIKHRDEHADSGKEITEAEQTSVTTGRTLDQIAEGVGGERVWHSDRAASSGRKASTSRKRSAPARHSGATSPAGASSRSPAKRFPSLTPMLATIGSAAPEGSGWIFEPKYDGIRVLAFVAGDAVALITRNGYDKARQFPEVVEALREFGRDAGTPAVLDGEIVALEKGKIVRFEHLQGRMHLQDDAAIGRLAKSSPVAFVVFDLLLEGSETLVHSTLTTRRKRLESLLEGRTNETLRISETDTDADALLQRARRQGWEGIIAKRASSKYRPGERSRDWLKLKLENRQEFVIGGWTEPRKSRPYLGAILLGYYDADGKLVYAGHTGTGFRQQTLEELHRRLKPLERKTPPFSTRPHTNEKAHWVSPRIVAEIKFNEWTKDGKLRQPVFVGIREDKDPREVVREPASSLKGDQATETQEDGRRPAGGGEKDGKALKSTVQAGRTGRSKGAGPGRTADKSRGDGRPARAGKTKSSRRAGSTRVSGNGAEDLPETPAFHALRKLADRNGGELKLGKNASIQITNLDKVFYPRTGHTKGDILEYYARMSEYVLPAMRDRPLVLKRFPNGVEGESFYQQAAPDDVPPGVRVETLKIEGKEQRRLVGGNVATLLYTIQLGAISYDPWHSRVGDLESADYAILDLDPSPGADFRTVVEVARLVKEQMDEFGLRGAIKTSGSAGLHIYLPLKRHTPLDAAALVAQIVATRVAQSYPEIATIERMTKKRPRGTVYVDYLQNSLGKSVAGVYAVRAKPQPTVSTPISWDELTDDLTIEQFTIDTVPRRVAQVGDIWAEAMAKPNSLDRLLRQVA